MEEVKQTIEINLSLLIPIVLVLLGLLIFYFVLIVRAVLQMLKYEVQIVLLTFAFLSLIPLPPFILMGIMILIIWHFHKKDIIQ
jgi:hypothetical protein